MKQIGAEPRDGHAVKQVFFTRKGNALYAITPYLPIRELVIRNIKTSVSSQVSMLGVPGQLASTAKNGMLTIRVPELTADSVPSRHAYVFKIAESELLPE